MYLYNLPAHGPARPRHAKLVEVLGRAGVPVPELLELLDRKPGIAAPLEALTEWALHGPSEIAPGMRELLAAWVARAHGSFFLVAAHAAVAAELLGDAAQVARVLDHGLEGLNAPERALFTFATKLSRDGRSVEEADIAQLRSFGWSDSAIGDAIFVCALIGLYVPVEQGTGIVEAPPGTHRIRGRYVAEHGYEAQRRE